MLYLNEQYISDARETARPNPTSNNKIVPTLQKIKFRGAWFRVYSMLDGAHVHYFINSNCTGVRRKFLNVAALDRLRAFIDARST